MEDIKILSAREVVAGAVHRMGMPLTTLARRSGVSYDAVCRGVAANGSGRIKAEELVRYCIVLGLTFSDFVQEGARADADTANCAG